MLLMTVFSWVGTPWNLVYWSWEKLVAHQQTGSMQVSPKMWLLLLGLQGVKVNKTTTFNRHPEGGRSNSHRSVTIQIVLDCI